MVFVVTFVLICPAAAAHRLNVFATADGAQIHGSTYFSDDKPARDVLVHVLGPDNQKLGETRTNDRGKFDYTAQHACDHTFVVETIDGHRGTFTVKAAELPETLPKLGNAAATSPPAKAEAATPPSGTSAAAPGTGTPANDAAMRALVEEAVSRELEPLREQLDAYQHSIRVHDILGGIGYIVGVMGVLALLKSRPRKGPH